MPRRATRTSFGAKDGNDPRKGKPGPGRPTNSFYLRLRTILERTDTAKKIEEILKDKDHPQFARVLEYTTDRAFGKLPQSVEQKHEGDITVHVVRDEAGA